jgi:hypothetical protein
MINVLKIMIAISTYHLDASVDFRVTIVKEERVLSVILDLTLALWLPAHIVIVARFEYIIILLLIVGDVSTLRGLNELKSTLKKRLRISVCQHFWMIINN